MDFLLFYLLKFSEIEIKLQTLTVNTNLCQKFAEQRPADIIYDILRNNVLFEFE